MNTRHDYSLKIAVIVQRLSDAWRPDYSIPSDRGPKGGTHDSLTDGHLAPAQGTFRRFAAAPMRATSAKYKLILL